MYTVVFQRIEVFPDEGLAITGSTRCGVIELRLMIGGQDVELEIVMNPQQAQRMSDVLLAAITQNEIRRPVDGPSD